MLAITRLPGARFAECELTYLARAPIDLQRALEQHGRYRAALESFGASVHVMPADDALPDACFVEDAALVLDEVAVIARPGVESRVPEVGAVAAVLQQYRPLEYLTIPATLDGGDVLRVGRTIYVGIARSVARTNREGAEALRRIAEPFGYRTRIVEFDGCLHLQSAVTTIGDESVLLNPSWVEPGAFHGVKCLSVASEEPNAANALLINGRVMMPASAARTAERLGKAGYDVTPVDVSEFEKAEAGVTCLVLLVDGEPGTANG